VLVQDEATDRNIALYKEGRCAYLAGIINTVYSSGSGMEYRVEVFDNYTLGGGLVILGPFDGSNSYFCSIDKGSVREAVRITPGEYTIRNEDNEVKII
jgi:hypothetical protein